MHDLLERKARFLNFSLGEILSWVVNENYIVFFDAVVSFSQ